MKKVVLAGMILMTLAASSVFAAFITDEVTFSESEGYISGLGDYIEWTHEFVFEPAMEDVTSASLILSLIDDGADSRTFFGFTLPTCDQEAAWVIVDPMSDAGLIEVLTGIFTGDDAINFIDDVDTKDYGFSVNTEAVADGSFSVKLASAFGDFSIEKSVLAINYTPASVPEPTALSLLGFGLLGLAGLARKKKC